ncbi:MAG TPA: nucleotide exchange factor GrpE [Candidatus Nanoarchaeia archaeon]|nr:nucleotide exchange factor GrpE [Candidatus Nanoarchaeia archaeon]
MTDKNQEKQSQSSNTKEEQKQQGQQQARSNIKNAIAEAAKAVASAVSSESDKTALLTGKITELTDTLKRLQAEFENYKKRCDREKAESCSIANASIIRKFLPFLDAFEIAIKSNSERKDEYSRGIELLYAQFFSLMEAEGVRRMDAAGKRFDPHQHEVLLIEKSDKPEETIIEELQRGYLLNGIVLRTAKVKISQHIEGNKDAHDKSAEKKAK